MKVHIDVSLDTYYPSLSAELQQQIQREVNLLLASEINVSEDQPTIKHGARRLWRNHSDGSILSNPYRLFKPTGKSPQKGKLCQIVAQLIERETFTGRELVELIEGILGPSGRVTETIIALWSEGYIDSLGMRRPQDVRAAAVAAEAGV